MKEVKKTTLHLNPHFNKKLIEISEVREANHMPVKTKQGIVEQLIEAAHKKEVK